MGFLASSASQCGGCLGSPPTYLTRTTPRSVAGRCAQRRPERQSARAPVARPVMGSNVPRGLRVSVTMNIEGGAQTSPAVHVSGLSIYRTAAVRGCRAEPTTSGRSGHGAR